MSDEKPVRVSFDTLFDRLWAEESDVYPEGVPFVDALKHGSMSVELFAPRDDDLQQPHDQDELYLIIEGTSGFQLGEEKLSVAAGDVLFVPANTPHHFFSMAPSFMTWAVFWGPTGGESE